MSMTMKRHVFTFSKRLMISFFTSFWGFSVIEVVKGESLNKSSIPELDWGLFSTVFAGVFLSFLDASSGTAAEHSNSNCVN